MKNRFILFVIFLFCFSTTFSQNLVLNGSFEETEKCVAYIGRFNIVNNWSKPTSTTTDLFNDCVDSQNGIPNNYNGIQSSKNGHKYAGIYTYSDDNYREYIQGELTNTLIKDKEYLLQFYVSLAENSDFSIKEMHVLFSKKSIKINHTRELSSRFLKKYKISDFKRFTVKSEQFYTNTDQWILIELKFKATGNENFFTIGNMNKNSKTEKRQRSRKNRQNISYYYIDQVSIKDLNLSEEITNNSKELTQKEVQIDSHIEPSFDLEKTYTLTSVQFEFDSAQLLPDSTKDIDKLVDHLKQNPNLKVTINGHTDYLGKAAYNQQLSENRAKSVADYLIEKGIESSRITYKGYGESQLIDPNEPEDAQAKNRRVEFVLSE